MDGHAREDLEAAELTVAGWTRAEGNAGWWLDPASGRSTPAWRALELARRDAHARSPNAADVALRELAEALDEATVGALQVRLELQRKIAANSDSVAELAAAREATQKLRSCACELRVLAKGASR